VLAFFLVLLEQVQFFSELAHHFHIRVVNQTCQRAYDDLPTPSVGSTVYFPDKHQRIGDVFAKAINHTLVSFGICTGYVIADADVATLKATVLHILPLYC
jgi:hypothetical protein